MKPIPVRLPEKSKPRVTVGRKATDRRAGCDDGWVAELELMITPERGVSAFRLLIPNGELQMDRGWDGTHSFSGSRCGLVRHL